MRVLRRLPMDSANVAAHEGHKRFRSGAWRLSVFAGVDPDTGRQRYVHETVHAPNTYRPHSSLGGLTPAEYAERWTINQPALP
jgi:transposase InsO family protein